jgi:hypothetical protein
VRASAEDQVGLARVQEVARTHLERFARGAPSPAAISRAISACSARSRLTRPGRRAWRA